MIQLAFFFHLPPSLLLYFFWRFSFKLWKFLFGNWVLLLGSRISALGLQGVLRTLTLLVVQFTSLVQLELAGILLSSNWTKLYHCYLKVWWGHWLSTGDGKDSFSCLGTSYANQPPLEKLLFITLTMFN